VTLTSKDLKTDGELSAQSDAFLRTVREVRELEMQKRAAARSSDEFHELADRVEEASRAVFDQAQQQRLDGEEDSPDPQERAQSYPGDWTS
jgi:hypothetical protein